MSNVIALKLPLGASNVRLPLNYEQAREALARCERIDECQDWADRAEALSSYARQINDATLRALADRIQARAVRRAGELLKPFDGRGNSNGSDTISQRQAAKQANLSLRQQRTAVRVADISPEEFEQTVESYKPPTISQLALMGRKRRPPRSDTPPPREEETKATAPRGDFLTPSDADRGIILLAERVDHTLFLPPPGILACLREALARASPKHRKAIEEAAYSLSELVK